MNSLDIAGEQVMVNRNDRVVAAVLVAPLIIFVVFEVVALVLDEAYQLHYGPYSDQTSIYVSVLLYASALLLVIYPLTLIVGLPAYIVLRRRNRATVLNAAIVGFVTGFVATSAFMLYSALQRLQGGHVFNIRDFWIRGIRNTLELSGAVGTGGLIIGLTFWLIAEYPQWKAKIAELL